MEHRGRDPLIPKGTEKLVQHIAFAVDWRGPILLRYDDSQNMACIKNEVWIMTHAEIQIDFSHFGLWDDRVYDVKDWLLEDFFEQISERLNDGINLTLVGLELTDAEELLGFHNLEGKSIEQQLRNVLLLSFNLRERRNDNLHVKTWAEYTATLSPQQLEIESLPPGVGAVHCRRNCH